MTPLWIFIAIIATAVLAFISVIFWLETRRKEREAHYRNEMARRIAEAADPSPLLAYVHEMERIDAARTRTKARFAGAITLAVGLSLLLFMRAVAAGAAAYLVGLMPLLVGVVLLLLSEFVLRPAATRG